MAKYFLCSSLLAGHRVGPMMLFSLLLVLFGLELELELVVSLHVVLVCLEKASKVSKVSSSEPSACNRFFG